jgi:hypothetical protein
MTLFPTSPGSGTSSRNWVTFSLVPLRSNKITRALFQSSTDLAKLTLARHVTMAIRLLLSRSKFRKGLSSLSTFPLADRLTKPFGGARMTELFGVRELSGVEPAVATEVPCSGASEGVCSNWLTSWRAQWNSNSPNRIPRISMQLGFGKCNLFLGSWMLGQCQHGSIVPNDWWEFELLIPFGKPTSSSISPMLPSASCR